MHTIRTHVAKPTVIAFMSPVLVGVTLFSMILFGTLLTLITPIPGILNFIGCGAVFAVSSIAITAMEPHIDRVIFNHLLRVSCALGWRWPGYPRLSTKNYWPTKNAEFNA